MVMTTKKKPTVKKVITAESDKAVLLLELSNTLQAELAEKLQIIEKQEELNSSLHVTIIDIAEELHKANTANVNLINRQKELDILAADLSKKVNEYSENIRVSTIVLKNASSRIESLEVIIKDTLEERNEVMKKLTKAQMRVQKTIIFKYLPFWKKIQVLLNPTKLNSYFS